MAGRRRNRRSSAPADALGELLTPKHQHGFSGGCLALPAPAAQSPCGSAPVRVDDVVRGLKVVVVDPELAAGEVEGGVDDAASRLESTEVTSKLAVQSVPARERVEGHQPA